MNHVGLGVCVGGGGQVVTQGGFFYQYSEVLIQHQFIL